MNETDSLGFGPHVFIVSVQTAPVPLHTREGYSIWNTHSVTFDPLSTVTHTHTMRPARLHQQVHVHVTTAHVHVHVLERFLKEKKISC